MGHAVRNKPDDDDVDNDYDDKDNFTSSFTSNLQIAEVIATSVIFSEPI